ncbi:MAG: dihydrolipoyl dehydrogenase [Candidatus Hydrogenedentota bacterium]|nr:MAG: dihydrolipoyl dehydrogenase [Candidatus Hydrogenedentota bacterium]
MAPEEKRKLVVIGAGPGGYAAAFHAADHGLDVTLVDRAPNPGGVCLYRGCIPSKALLHIAKVISEARDLRAGGVYFEEPRIELNELRAWKESVVGKLTGGLGHLARKRKLRYLQGTARFTAADTVSVIRGDGTEEILRLDNAILATGSVPARIPGLPQDSPSLWDSTRALELPKIPRTLLVIGGGYIGLELGSVYSALGTEVSCVEVTKGLLPGVDRDLVRPLEQRIRKSFSEILLETKVTEVRESENGLAVTVIDRNGKATTRDFEAVLVAVGRRPTTEGLGLETTRIRLTDRGFVQVDDKRRTTEKGIFAIGDIAGNPMLAHKASAEAKTAVEAILGERAAAFDPKAIPAVVFTDPEIAWCGLTETEAKAKEIPVKVCRFPWAASGRATTMGRTDGLTKLILDPEDETVLGVGVVGPGAGELISEGVLAIEMGAVAADLKESIHPHPTLSETVMEAAESFFGHATHLY